MQSKSENKKVAILISGTAYLMVQRLENSTLDVFTRDILLEADSVILYRSSPKQKADAVNMVKDKLNGKKLTLAIGDGFNDVSMI